MEEDYYLRKQRIQKTIMLVIVTVFLTFILTTLYITNKFDSNSKGISTLIGSSNSENSILDKIKDIRKILEKYYINDIDEKKTTEGALKGYVAGLGDPYTEYITAEEMEEYSVSLSGNYVGIGIYISTNVEKNAVEVLMPIEGGPAAEAGLQAGDIIVSVDGKKYSGDNVDDAADAIKGKEGTTVKLEVLRNQELKIFEIVRRKVTTNPVISERLENNIGYIQITSFDEETAENFKVKFEELKKQGITSLIIDLRNNGGGLLDVTLQIADYIVPKGKELLITVDKDQKEEIEKAKENVLIDMPIVVLVNGMSASASEILAGALKDLNEATIVGTTTYGKGVIQELIPFRDGSAIKVTIYEYFTPNRNKINGVGIEPHEVVELSKDSDNQLQRAIEILK